MSRMERIDKGTEEIKAGQAEQGRRTEIEREAERLISQCRFQEAMTLLNTLD